ncbi:MAG: ATP-binding protein [Cucumibacter sp.]
MPPAPRSYSRLLGKSLPEVGDAVCWVAEIADGASLDPNLSYAMQVCVEEALTNIVRHGRCAVGPGEIRLAVALAPRGARVTIEDDCVPFDVTSAVAAPAHNEPDDPEIGGWGIGLIRAFASRLAYARDNDRNRLILEFDRSPAPA